MKHELDAALPGAPPLQIATGLTGHTVLLPSEDAAAYTAQLALLEAEWKPATDAERALVQSIADTGWRLLRLPRLEAGIYALGRLEFAGVFDNQDESQRSLLLDAKIYLTYQRQLNNLSVQEARLRRQREKDSAALRELQAERIRQSKPSLDDAARAYLAAAQLGRRHKFDPAALGFEFSIQKIEARAAQLKPNPIAEWQRRQAARLKDEEAA